MIQAPSEIARILNGYRVTYADEPNMKSVIDDIGSVLPDFMPAVIHAVASEG